MSGSPAIERRGLTLIEVLVTVTIIGLLIGLLIPAVQSARGAARRARCLNNLRQIALGLANYESAAGSFPPAMAEFDYSFLVSILPYMEHKSLFNSLNLQHHASFGPAENFTARSNPIEALLCPADPLGWQDPDGFGWTNYAGSRGRGVQTYGEDGAFRFPPGSVTSTREFTDGLSSTAMVSEWLVGGGGEPADPRRPIFQTPTRLSKPEEYEQFAVLCHSLDVSRARVNGHIKGQNWMYGELGFSLYNHVMLPNDHSCLNGTGYQVGAWTTGSLHGDGVNVAFGGGNARFVSRSIGAELWRAMGSRNGGDVASVGE